MISGREAFGNLEQAIQGLRGDERQLDAALHSAMDESARARQVEAEGFRALARVKLDQLAGSKVVGDLDMTERRSLDMISGERAALDALDKRRSAAEAELAAGEAQKQASGRALETAIRAIEAKHRLLAQGVNARSDWQAAQQAISEAQKIATAAEEKSKRAADDLAQKRKPYEADPLFLYLWKRKHGTGDDHTSFFVRFFDRRVAALIAYSDARANYAMLLAIPARLAEHTQSRIQAVEDAKKAQDGIERKALIEAGIEALESELATAQNNDQAAQARVAATTSALKSVDDERSALLSSDSAGRSAAISLLIDRLTRADMRQLYADAFKTPTPDDENALNAITRARQQIAAADASLASTRNQIQAMAQKRAELEGARDHARGQGYDSPWGTFSNHDILSDIIRGVVTGVVSGSDLGRAMSSGYRPRESGSNINWGGGLGSGSPWSGGQSSEPAPTSSGWKTTDSF